MPDPKPKLLLVDDEPLVRSALRRALKHEFDIIEAGNGFEGAQHFRTDPEIRRVLSDARMHGGDGQQFHEQIAQELAQRQGRFIVLTGQMPDPMQTYFEDRGISIYEKPFDVETLAAAFRNMDTPSRPE